MRRFGLIAAGLALAASTALAQPQAQTPPPAEQQAPDAKAIVEGACTMCHGLDFIAERRKSHDDWEFTVRRMMDKGAALDEGAFDLVVDYLAKTYPAPPKPAPANP